MTQPHSIDVLLVEDNPADAELTIRNLKKHGLANHMTWVKDGAEALALVLGTSGGPGSGACIPRVILLDLRLPKVDGLEVLKKLKSDPRARLIPVVILTSSTQDEDRVKSYELGGNSFVSKPVQFEQFAEVIRQLGMYWLVVNKPVVPER